METPEGVTVVDHVEEATQTPSGEPATVVTWKVVEPEVFEAELEIRRPPGGNNGLAIRYPGEGDTAYVGMCELQVLDNTAEKYAGLKEWQYHGSAYGMAPAHRGYLRLHPRPVQAWRRSVTPG